MGRHRKKISPQLAILEHATEHWYSQEELVCSHISVADSLSAHAYECTARSFQTLARVCLWCTFHATHVCQTQFYFSPMLEIGENWTHLKWIVSAAHSIRREILADSFRFGQHKMRTQNNRIDDNNNYLQFTIYNLRFSFVVANYQVPANTVWVGINTWATMRIWGHRTSI